MRPFDRRARRQGRVPLRFAYERIGPTGSIDQTLKITNPSSDRAVIPTLSFQALDLNAEPLDQVTITTIYGSDRGLVVTPAYSAAFDILRFQGTGSELVRDVKVTVKSLRVMKDRGTEFPEVDFLDARGKSMDVPWTARTVRVHNPGPSGYVVGIRWNLPPKGQSQQARAVSSLGHPFHVAGQDDADLTLRAEDVGQWDSVKVYLSVE